MNNYKDKFSQPQWWAICEEVYKERFVADYSCYLNEQEPKSFEPRSKQERQYFDEAYEEYLYYCGIDRADRESFELVNKEMAKRGWSVETCPHCKQPVITRYALPKEVNV